MGYVRMRDDEHECIIMSCFIHWRSSIMSLYDGGGYLKIDFKIVMISWLKKPRNIQVRDINPKPHSSGILGGGGGQTNSGSFSVIVFFRGHVYMY